MRNLLSLRVAALATVSLFVLSGTGTALAAQSAPSAIAAQQQAAPAKAQGPSFADQIKVTKADIASCDTKAPGPFNPQHEYTCAYIDMAASSLPLADHAKLQQFVNDWNPGKWQAYLNKKGLTQQEAMDRTFALIRRMRDALGNPEPFDYVFTPQQQQQQNQVVNPTLNGGIGAFLKLENAWQILAQADKLPKTMTPEAKVQWIKAHEVIDNTHHLLIQAPEPDSPSWGVLQPGDAVVSINGQSLNGLTMTDALKLIKGAVGSSVTLGILRTDAHGVQQPLTLTLKRAVVHGSAVMIQDSDGIRHITITDFENDHLLGDFYNAIVGAQKANMKGIILDVRGNPGGNLAYVEGMLEMLVNRGQILMTRQREPGTDKVLQTQFVMDGQEAITQVKLVGASEDTKQFAVQGRVQFSQQYEDMANLDPSFVEQNPLAPAIDTSMPVVVLVNNDSYSASEIFTGGLQATHRATVIGVPSAGKDDIMSMVPLPEYRTDLGAGNSQQGGLAIIGGLFYPGGKDTDRTGVIPNDIVKQAPDFGKTDAQLSAAMAAIEQAHAELVAQQTAAGSSRTANSNRFHKEIQQRNQNDQLPPNKQNKDLQQ